MAELARGYSFVMYTAKAGASYTVPFPFLHTDDIHVFAGDVGDAVEQAVKWLGPTQLQLAGEVPEGILVTVRRFTPRGDLLVTFKDGAKLPAADMNTAARQLLFAIQEQIDFGSYGGSGLPGGGSGWPNPDGGTPDLNIQQIIDQLAQSPVMQLLWDRVEPVDALGESLLEELLRSDQMFDARRALDRRVTLAETTITTLADDTHSLAQQTTELYAQHDGLAAQVVDVKQALATETEARALDVQMVKAAYRAGDEAISQSLQTTYATKDYAQAVASQQVEAWAGDNFSILQERFEALVDGTADPSSANAWQANWSVRINAGAIGGTPVIAGIGLGVDSKSGSNFVVMSDRFAVVSPTYTATGGVQQIKYPFVVGTVGGVSTVGITGQLIVDGSVTADKITTNTLSAISANMGEVNGGTFRTFQLNAQGAIIDPLEFRAEMTNKPSDPYPMWVGAGVKSWNNAVFAVDRSGNAKFAGTVSALNVTDQLQTQVTASWSGDVGASDAAVITSFTLPAPVRLGESHRPLLFIELFIKGTDADGLSAAGATVVFERLVGSTWVTIRSGQWAVYKYTGYASTSVISDTATTASQQYRIRLAGGDVDFRVTAANIYAVGLR